MKIWVFSILLVVSGSGAIAAPAPVPTVVLWKPFQGPVTRQGVVGGLSRARLGPVGPLPTKCNFGEAEDKCVPYMNKLSEAVNGLINRLKGIGDSSKRDLNKKMSAYKTKNQENKEGIKDLFKFVGLCLEDAVSSIKDMALRMKESESMMTKWQQPEEQKVKGKNGPLMDQDILYKLGYNKENIISTSEELVRLFGSVVYAFKEDWPMEEVEIAGWKTNPMDDFDWASLYDFLDKYTEVAKMIIKSSQH